MFYLWMGLTPAADIDERFFQENLDSRGLSGTIKDRMRKKTQRIQSDLDLISSAIDKITQVYKNSGIESIYLLFDDIHPNSRHHIISRGLRIMREHCSTKIESSLKLNTKLKAKQGRCLQDQIRLIFERMVSEVWEEVSQKRQRDRRNKVMRKLEKEGCINRLELPRRFHKEFREAAFFLTQAGADRVAQFANFQREQIRSYKFHVHTAKHEIITARVLRSIVMQQEQQGYKITELYDEPKVRKIFHTRKRNIKAIPDLVLIICAQNKKHEFWIEIDNGSQPVTKLVYLTQIKLGLIIVTSSKDIAIRRRRELIMSSDAKTPFFITTSDRIVQQGLFDAGYITKERSEFCVCEQLVIDTDRNCICDKHGCPCILRYYYGSEQGKLEKVGAGATKPESVVEQPPVETQQPVPSPVIGSTRKRASQKKQETTMLGLSISNWLWLTSSISIVYYDAKHWRFLATFVDWIEKFF